jgi:uncharacterized protein YkwD
MKARQALSLLASLLLSTCCQLAHAQEPVPAQVAAPTLSPMQQEIRGVLEQEQNEVLALSARITEEHDGQKLLALQRAVEAAKQHAQIAVFEVQIRHARSEGETEAIAALESSLTQLRAPQLAAKPVVRPE